MPDEKYGQLYTHNDLSELINVATAAATLGEVLDADEVVARFYREQGQFTFPDDEPLFVLRAKDRAVNADVLGTYIDECENIGAGSAHTNRVGTQMGRIIAWQMQNQDRTKVPD